MCNTSDAGYYVKLNIPRVFRDWICVPLQVETRDLKSAVMVVSSKCLDVCNRPNNVGHTLSIFLLSAGTDHISVTFEVLTLIAWTEFKIYRMGHEKLAGLPFYTCPCYCINFCIYAMLRTLATFSWLILYNVYYNTQRT